LTEGVAQKADYMRLRILLEERGLLTLRIAPSAKHHLGIPGLLGTGHGYDILVFRVKSNNTNAVSCYLESRIRWNVLTTKGLKLRIEKEGGRKIQERFIYGSRGSDKDGAIWLHGDEMRESPRFRGKSWVTSICR
jgi:hypothetical protein